MALSDDLVPVKNVIARVERIGEKGLSVAERVAGNPEAEEAAEVLAQLAGLTLPAGYIAGLFATAKNMLSVFTGTPAAATQ